MTTAQQPMTQAAVRSLLWDGAPNGTVPLPDNAEQLDELTLAKIRLLDMRRPPRGQLATVLHNPIPWIVGALFVGGVLGRSKAARGALAWVGARVVTRTAKTAARQLAARNVYRSNGRGTRARSRAPGFLSWLASP